ncbi:MAG: YbaK/EbsC family protein [Pseudomonadota bacterium]
MSGAARAATGPERVRAALEAAGVAADIREMDASTRTAEEAAAACGVSVAQIVKSLVFQGAGAPGAAPEPWLILVSGANRVHEKRLGRALGVKLARADADWVRRTSGFAIGGVAPVGALRPMATAIDADLADHETLFAAAGGPRHVFRTDFETLRRLTGGRVETVT